jgi:GT2 family glycosyltransferase
VGRRDLHALAREARERTPPRLTEPGVPTVTVVVPVHGQWAYTRKCLHALSRTAGGHSFEVVVVDDASPDRTRQHLRRVRGVRVVELDQNLGFVGACNAGIAAARGQFVVLLNNDTAVHPEWLSAMLEAMEDPTVGLVGSRLVYPDGRLQEAGGIVFADGTAWNYGRFADPELPQFTYRRDVDYCSGASVMVRRSILDQLGGLDERLAPAYYDDTDLAFGVRSLGYRVVYEPASIVVHYEGISNGTDEAHGVKSHQVINRGRFAEKWAAELAAHPAPGAAGVERAARRRQGAGIVVVVDHIVPEPDNDSGSVRMAAALRTLRGLGYAVVFIPSNRQRTEPYTRELQCDGIEVVYGTQDQADVLRAIADDVIAVMICRVDVAAVNLLPMRRIFPDAPLIYDTVDLHFLRVQRAEEVAGRTTPSPFAHAVQELELAAIRSADLTLVVSEPDKQALAEMVPQAPVAVVSNVHVVPALVAEPVRRDRVLFVGSFAHHPNGDAVQWFVEEVLPRLTEAAGGPVQVDIVGKGADPALVAASPRGVTFLGWVPDLHPVYAQARVVIAPLRFGAGVKGKIGEALSLGVPVVTTSVGAEGMGLVDGESALVADDPDAFASAVARLLVDDDLWRTMSSAGHRLVADRFGEDRFRQALVAALEAAREARDASRAGR